MGEGFIVGNRSHPAEHLTGRPLLPTEALTVNGIDPTAITLVTETLFEGRRKPELFEPPLVLIRENHSLPMAYWDNGPLAYGHEIVGIHAPASERKELHRLFRDLAANLDLHRFAVLLNSPRALVTKATAILKSDIESLPYPEDETELELTFWEQALADDTLQVHCALRAARPAVGPSNAGSRRRRSPRLRLAVLPDAGQPLRQPSSERSGLPRRLDLPAVLLRRGAGGRVAGPRLRGTTGEPRFRPDAAIATDRTGGSLLPSRTSSSSSSPIGSATGSVPPQSGTPTTRSPNSGSRVIEP